MDVSFADPQHGYVAVAEDNGDRYGAGIVMRTTDGGLNWEEHSVDGWLEEVFDLGGGYAWAVADTGSIFRTTDGAATWSDDGDIERRQYYSDLVFADELHGWVLSNKGRGILASGDGGETWGRALRTKHHLIRIAVSPDGTAWAVGKTRSSPSRAVLMVGREKKDGAATTSEQQR